MRAYNDVCALFLLGAFVISSVVCGLLWAKRHFEAFSYTMRYVSHNAQWHTNTTLSLFRLYFLPHSLTFTVQLKIATHIQPKVAYEMTLLCRCASSGLRLRSTLANRSQIEIDLNAISVIDWFCWRCCCCCCCCIFFLYWCCCCCCWLL